MEDLKKVQEELGAEKLKNAALEAALEEQNTLIEAMKKKGSSKSSVKTSVAAVTIPTETFKIGTAEYRFTVPSFTHEGEKYDAADVLKDKALLQELVDGGFGIIEKVK